MAHLPEKSSSDANTRKCTRPTTSARFSAAGLWNPDNQLSYLRLFALICGKILFDNRVVRGWL
jgi:hypothetical protein